MQKTTSLISPSALQVLAKRNHAELWPSQQQNRLVHSGILVVVLVIFIIILGTV
jgi:hypothetical protein